MIKFLLVNPETQKGFRLVKRKMDWKIWDWKQDVLPNNFIRLSNNDAEKFVLHFKEQGYGKKKLIGNIK